MSDPFDTGVVTVMFTDVEGSTDLTRRLGDEAARSTIENHRRIVREQLAAHDGREIDSIGDGFMLTFLSTRRAILCAIAIQQALAEHAREHPEEAVKLRIGVNVGEVLERGGHPFGAAVNATQRVGAHAKGGQIFVSEPVRHLAGTIPEVQFKDRGRFTLKGFPERWRLFEVVWAPPEERAAKLKPAARLKPAAKPSAGRRLVVLAALGVAVLAAVVVAFLVLRGGGTKPLTSVTPNSVGIVDPGNNDIVGQVRVGTGPVDITDDEERQKIWVANLDAGTISEIDRESEELVGTFNAGKTPRGITAGEGAIWVANVTDNQVSVVDPDDGHVIKTVSDLAGPKNIAAGLGAVWVATHIDESVVRIDPATGRQSRVGSGTAVALGRDVVWIADGSTVKRVDPDTANPVGRPFTLRFPASQLAVADDGAVWVTHTTADAVSRIDPATGSQQTIEDVGNDPTGIAVDEDAVWVASSLGRALVRIGLDSRAVEEQIPLGSAPEAIVVADGRVWVTTMS